MKINTLDIKELADEENVLEIYLFGSYARGEADAYSDIDILIVINDCNEDEYIRCKDKYANILKIPVEWISLYRYFKIKQMHISGSYFLWHIKNEGHKLYSKNNQLENILYTLPKYKNVKNDLNEYLLIISDIEKELDRDNIIINYELSVMASLVRNTCIALSYINGIFDFGRKSVIMTCKKIYPKKIQFSIEEYIILYEYRLFQTGKLAKISDGDICMLKKWIDIEKELIKLAFEGVEEYE